MPTNNSTVPTPPRATGNAAEDNRALINWAFDLYRVVVIEQQFTTRLNAIANLAPLTTAISNPPTQAEVQEIQAKINAIITAATPASASN